ncbi:MAG TPA: IS481 family transposase [Allosphingosinicella sp.]|jgi:transposase InsO family protein
MDAHQNARTTPLSRHLIVARLAQGWTVSAVATALGIDPKTVRKWRDRFAAEGTSGLSDRSSRPHRSPTRRDAATTAEIARLRRERLSGPAIARQMRIPCATVGAVLRRLGLGRLSALTPPPPVIRYERERPGELIHLDTKKLGRIDGVGHRITGDRQGRKRGLGWEALHVAVDDASRLAYTEILPDETKASATAFLERALTWFESLGITVERVMTDNGSAYKSHLFRDALAARAIAHKRTRPYTPRTNGKAERFIQTTLREWLYASPYASSDQRKAAMRPWLCAYNRRRPHAAHGGKPPISRLAKDNLLGNDT